MRTLARVLSFSLLFASPLAPAVLAQPPAAQVTPEQKTDSAREQFQAAIARARSERRVLVATYSNSVSNAKANQAALSASATQAWLNARAITIDVTDKPLIAELVQSGFVTQPGQDPLVLVDGRVQPIIAPHNASRKGSAETLAGSLALAQRLDWSIRTSQLDGAKAFADDNDRAAANAQPSALPTLSSTGSGEGPQRVEPFQPGAVTPDTLLPLLNQARDKARAKPLESAAIYTWLWENADALNPAFSAVRTSVMAAEMHALAKANPAARAHFRTLRDREASRVDLRRYVDIHTYLILCRVIEDHVHNSEFYDASLGREDAKAVIPPDDREAFERLLPLCHFNDPTQNASDPWRTPVRLFNRANDLGKRKDPASHAALIDYHRWLAMHEASRRYAWVLPAQGDASAKPARAQAIIDRALPLQDTPQFRAMLALTARASGKSPAPDLEQAP